MVTEINHQLVKERILEIILANPQLYNEQVPSKALLNNGYVGLPDGYNWSNWPFPYVCITNDPNFETDKPFGGVVGNMPNASYSTSFHVVNYMIIIMVSGPNAAKVEATLDNLHQLVKQTLKSNFQFANPETELNDLNIEQSILTTSKYVDGGSHKGKTINGIIINCQVKIITGQ